MRMRTLLLLPLVLIPALLTLASLLILRGQMQRQMQESLAADLRHSAATYRNLEQQRRTTLSREAILLAYQPSLKALMTTQDSRTIQDEGLGYAKLSDTELFGLLSPGGKVVALYDSAGPPGDSPSRSRITSLLEKRPGSPYLFDGQRLFEIAIQPVYFGSAETGSLLGYVVIGSLVDDSVAAEVSQTASSEIAFSVDSQVISSTLPVQARLALTRSLRHSANAGKGPLNFDPETPSAEGPYLTDHIDLAQDEAGPISLIVLRSTRDLLRIQQRLNRSVFAIGLAALIAGGFLAFFISQSLTSPLEGLARAVSAVGTGDYQVSLPSSGAAEIRALSASIETMRGEIRETQNRLLEAERLATIGQMASSVSHDLRHYLASVYANAEFLASADLTDAERADLLSEIHLSVQGTTDLIDSLLLFTSTGRALQLTYESITYLAERAMMLISKHPEASGVSMSLSAATAAEAWVDAKKIERAIYNLLLNACQASRRGHPSAAVKVEIREADTTIQLRVSDSGPGVSPAIRDSLFDPFVSAGKENGVGIGLTIVSTIASEHGGSVCLENNAAGETVFIFTLDRRSSLNPPRNLAEEHAQNILKGTTA